MVLGEKFIWAHLGKTGGNSTKKMFDFTKQLVLKSDDISDPIKHLSFEHIQERGFNINQKDRILNIRRLPQFIISFIMHKKVHDKVDFNKEEINKGIVRQPSTPTELDNIKRVHVDDILRYYEPDKIMYWLRTEYLAQDFIKVISNFKLLSNIEKGNILRTNENSNSTNVFSPENFWTNDELVALYDACPIWASYEKKLYGNLLV